MANRAEKLRKTKESCGSPIIKIGKQTYNDVPIELGRLVAEGYEIREKIGTLKQRLEEIDAAVIEKASDYMLAADSGSCHVQYSGSEAHVVIRDSVSIKDPQHLIEVLGPVRFDDLVRKKVLYTPERKLIELAAEESGLAEAVRECLTLKEAKISVSYRAI